MRLEKRRFRGWQLQNARDPFLGLYLLRSLKKGRRKVGFPERGRGTQGAASVAARDKGANPHLPRNPILMCGQSCAQMQILLMKKSGGCFAPTGAGPTWTPSKTRTPSKREPESDHQR